MRPGNRPELDDINDHLLARPTVTEKKSRRLMTRFGEITLSKPDFRDISFDINV
jgi:hypothetical protein